MTDDPLRNAYALGAREATASIPPPMAGPAPTPKLGAALAIAQGAFKPIPKSREVTVRPRDSAAYSYRYSTMADVNDGVQEALTANGLSITHAVHGRTMYSTLLHSSGEERVSDFDLSKVDSAKIQAFGSALSYGQRYNVKLLLNLASDDDDDGQQAQAAEPAKPRVALVRERTMTEGQKAELAKENVTVGQRPARGAETADSVEAAAKRSADEAIASFADMDIEALRLWWRDSADLREGWEAMFPHLHEKVLTALDNRRDEIKARQ